MKVLGMTGTASWVGVLFLALGTGCMAGAVELEHDGAGAGGLAPGGSSSGSAGGGAAHGGASTGSTTGGAAHAGASNGSGNRTGASEPGDPCDGSCSAGFECFQPASFTSGVCAPRCESQEQAAWGMPCGNSVAGGGGICLPFNKNLRIFGSDQVAGTGVGICTRTCSPLLQDCPDHFACDLTEDQAAAEPNRIFACLPLVEAVPRSVGASCDGFPVGQCAAGLSCVQSVTSTDFANCQVLCDSTDPDACDAAESCQIPDWFPPATTVGVCLP